MSDGKQTIEDFGRQWTVYQSGSDYTDSTALLADYVAPLDIDIFRDQRVADIGSGNGRFVMALLDAGAAHVVAVEPSQSVSVIRNKVASRPAGMVTIVNDAGDKLPEDSDLDLVVSLGVIHHIPEPEPVIQAAHRALRPGGKCIIWLYGREGNELYLSIAEPLRTVTKKMPHWALSLFSRLLSIPLTIYAFLCGVFSFLPMADYMKNVIRPQTMKDRAVTIYDQLNPHYAKYYRRDEALALMRSAPFDVEIFHRHGYGWTVVGTK